VVDGVVVKRFEMYAGWAICFFLALALWPFAAWAILKIGRRFSLRTLLIGTTLVAVGLGLIVWLQ
jgi:hypothetical protein